MVAGLPQEIPSWEKFAMEYECCLSECHDKFPGLYSWDISRAPSIANRLLQGFWDDSGVSYQGRALQLTIRRLMPKHGGLSSVQTREAVRAIVDNQKSKDKANWISGGA